VLVRLGVALGGIAAIGLIWVYLDLAALERTVEALGPWGPVALVLAFVLVTPALVPDTPFAAVAGALYGVVAGTALTGLAALLAAMLTFALSRWLLRDWLQRLLARHPRLDAVQDVVARGQKRLLILLRLVPVNPALVNYLLAATTVGFGRYLLSCLGLMPAYFAAAYLGWLARVSGAGARDIGAGDYVATAGFLATVIALVFAIRAARRALRNTEPPLERTPGE
jgi:uncharacterized membrane protein YdjX (TVP38/TMEM64 family)